MAPRLQQRTTAFVTAPIVFLAIAALAVVLGSLIIGARETDKIALAQQRETIEHALDQHGNALARELRVQTVWNEAYEKSHARDQAWLRTFYGEYLSQLFGYDGIYVLSARDEPVFAFADGRDEPPDAYLQIGGGLKDLVAAVRKPDAAPANYDIITTTITLGNGETIKHRAIADVRNIRGTPATVVVSTIVPDHTSATPVDSAPFLLVAIEDLDASFTKDIGAGFGLHDLKWIKGAAGVEPVHRGREGGRRRNRRNARLAKEPAGLAIRAQGGRRVGRRARSARRAFRHTHAMGAPAGPAARCRARPKRATRRARTR